MHSAPNSEPMIPGLVLKVSDEEARRLLGKWVVVDDEGHVKVVGDDFDQARLKAVAAGLDFEQVSFMCVPKHDLIG